MILSFPTGGKKSQNQETGHSGCEESLDALGDGLSARLEDSDYEKMLEQRVKELLKQVEGVGNVDVMIVLKSSEENVYRVDRNQTTDNSREEDAQGGLRTQSGVQIQENTVLAQSGGQSGTPIVEKTVRPEISGMIITASGGGSPVVKAEISSAMEALFNLPAHKIKVLKRVD